MASRASNKHSSLIDRAVQGFSDLDERSTSAIICILLGIAVWVAFGQVVHYDFVNYDDGDYVYENVIVKRGLTLSGIGWVLTHVHAANWHPVTTLSHMLDVQLYGLSPGGHHATNLVFHALSAILLF